MKKFNRHRKNFAKLTFGKETLKIVILSGERGVLESSYVFTGSLTELRAGSETAVQCIAFIRQAIKSGGIAINQVVVSLGEGQGFLREIEFPKMHKNELREAVKWELDQYAPYDADAYYYDFCILGDAPMDGGIRVLLAAAPKAIVEGLAELFAVLPLRLRRVDVMPLHLEARSADCVSSEAADFNANQINLLPPALRRADLDRVRRICAVSAGVGALLMAGVYFHGYMECADLTEQIKQDQASYQLLNPVLQRKEMIEQQNLLVRQKNDVLVELSAQNNSSYAVMVHLGHLITEEVWLTKVSLNGKNEASLCGQAADYPHLAQFLERFERDTLLKNAVLVNSEAVKSGSLAGVSFEITARYKGM